MGYQWRSGQFNDFADGTNYAFSSMNNPGYQTIVTLNIGERVVRTRLWGHIVVGQKDIHPTTYVPGEYVLGCNQLQVGVYYAGATGVHWPPPAVGQNPGDGNWLIRCQAQLQGIDTLLDVNSEEYAWGVYTIPDQAHDSEASRGKCTAATQIGLKWSFFNPVVDWWTENTADVLGLISMSLWCECLIETP